jgi:hypothetical protein
MYDQQTKQGTDEKSCADHDESPSVNGIASGLGLHDAVTDAMPIMS